MTNQPPERRADGEHSRHLPVVSGRGEPPAAVDLELSPSARLAARCPEMLDELQRLDDLVFEAIAGKRGSMEQLCRLWSRVRRQLEFDVLEASRAHYVRHALDAWRQCVDGEQLRNPRLALAALDIVDLLFND